MTKKCLLCGASKPSDLGHFYAAKTTSDGLQSYCKLCHREKNRKWGAENSERKKAIASVWRSRPEVKERELERQRKAQALNPSASRLRTRLSYYRNREKRLAARRVYGNENRSAETAMRTAWRKANPLKEKMASARWRARKHGCLIAPVVPERVIASRGMVCGICHAKITMSALTFDHIKPLCFGGEHAETNLQVAHYECNRKKQSTVAPVHKG